MCEGLTNPMQLDGPYGMLDTSLSPNRQVCLCKDDNDPTQPASECKAPISRSGATRRLQCPEVTRLKSREYEAKRIQLRKEQRAARRMGRPDSLSGTSSPIDRGSLADTSDQADHQQTE